MKTAISIPDEVFEAAERTAKRLGVSRSELFTRAVRAYLSTRLEESVTASYDAAFAEGDAKEAEFRRQATQKALLAVEWEQ